MKPVKKTWFLKYLIALVVSIVLAILLAGYLHTNTVYTQYRFLPYILPLIALSLVSVGKIIRRFVMYALEGVDTGDKAYNAVFKVILMISGILLLIPLIGAGVIIAVFEFIRDLGKYKEYKSNPSAIDSEEAHDEASPAPEKDMERDERELTIEAPQSVNVVNPSNITIQRQPPAE